MHVSPSCATDSMCVSITAQAAQTARIGTLSIRVQVDVSWRELVVGDVVRLENGSSVPADIIILSSSGHRGICHVETSNLDGFALHVLSMREALCRDCSETNLKIKQAVEATLGFNEPSVISSMRGTLVCEETNKVIEFTSPVLPTVARVHRTYTNSMER